MTVKLDLHPEVEAGLLAQARVRGLSLEAYVELVLRERSLATVPPLEDTIEKAQAFEAFAHGHRRTPLLTEAAVARANLVRDAQ